MKLRSGKDPYSQDLVHLSGLLEGPKANLPWEVIDLSSTKVVAQVTT